MKYLCLVGDAQDRQPFQPPLPMPNTMPTRQQLWTPEQLWLFLHIPDMAEADTLWILERAVHVSHSDRARTNQLLETQPLRD